MIKFPRFYLEFRCSTSILGAQHSLSQAKLFEHECALASKWNEEFQVFLDPGSGPDKQSVQSSVSFKYGFEWK